MDNSKISREVICRAKIIGTDKIIVGYYVRGD